MAETVVLELRVRPGASRDRVEGASDGRIRVCLSAPPVGGEANRRLIRFLADEFRVGTSSVKLLRGERSRHKRVEIVNPRALPAWLPVSAAPSAKANRRAGSR